jgi:hypothetical protein
MSSVSINFDSDVYFALLKSNASILILAEEKPQGKAMKSIIIKSVDEYIHLFNLLNKKPPILLYDGVDSSILSTCFCIGVGKPSLPLFITNHHDGIVDILSSKLDKCHFELCELTGKMYCKKNIHEWDEVPFKYNIKCNSNIHLGRLIEEGKNIVRHIIANTEFPVRVLSVELLRPFQEKSMEVLYHRSGQWVWRQEYNVMTGKLKSQSKTKIPTDLNSLD